MEIRKTNMEDWVLFGGGAVGESYYNKENPNIILKFNVDENQNEEMLSELETSHIVWEMGLPTPKPGEALTDGKRVGATFTRMPDKVSYARALGQHPDKVKEYAHDFAQIVKLMHGTNGNNGRLRNVKDHYKNIINKNPFHSDDFKRKAIKILESLPDGNSCLHGDLHCGNVIIAEGKSWLIDLGNFCYGYFMFDLAMTYIVSVFGRSNPAFHQEVFHHTAETEHEFWQAFAKEYFGPDVDIEKLQEDLTPYIAMRQFAMELDKNEPIPTRLGEKAFNFVESYQG